MHTTISEGANPKSVHGSFSFQNLLCHLFESNLAPSTVPEHFAISSRQLTMLRGVAEYAHSGEDSLPLSNMTPELAARTRGTLFHERMHYWQLISSPVHQLAFTIDLEKLRANVKRIGGRSHLIGGQLTGDIVLTEHELHEFTTSNEAHFLPTEFTDNMVVDVTPVAIDPRTAMAHLMLPHGSGVTKRLPAYGALMEFENQKTVVRVPFTARPLLESAAYLSELLYQEYDLPHPQRLDSDDDRIYLGTWEFWRRLHGERYATDFELGLSFLAAVDLAMLSDVTDDDIRGSARHLEVFSIPYRFGALALGARSIPPLSCGNLDPSLAVAQFQRNLCSYLGWASPDLTARKAAVFLTTVLLKMFNSAIPVTAENRELAMWLLNSRQVKAAADEQRLRRIWELLAIATKSSMPLISQSVLGTMLNASVYRVHNPGKFAVPHLYWSELTESFPLPIVYLGGEYYLDGLPPLNVCQDPYPCEPVELLHDCISLVAIEPLLRDKSSCGFVDSHVKCWYVSHGLGCPQEELLAASRNLREATGLHDWCHWTHRSLTLGIASYEVRDNWNRRWHSRDVISHMFHGGPRETLQLIDKFSSSRDEFEVTLKSMETISNIGERLEYYAEKAAQLCYRGHITSNASLLRASLKLCEKALETDQESRSLLTLKAILHYALGEPQDSQIAMERVLLMCTSQQMQDIVMRRMEALFKTRFNPNFVGIFKDWFEIS